jgi:hypothetical protein
MHVASEKYRFTITRLVTLEIMRSPYEGMRLLVLQGCAVTFLHYLTFIAGFC